MNRVEVIKKDLKYNIEKVFEKANDFGKCDNGEMIQIIAVVKCNGYGLGLIELSKYLLDNGIKHLAVASTEEALKLRNNNINCPILLMTPVIEKKELVELIQKDVTLTIGSQEELDLINKVYDELNVKKVKVHVKVDTGFLRIGLVYKNKIKVLVGFKNNKL